MNLKNFLGIAVAASALACAAGAQANVVTFDDLPDGVVPDGYGGITWNGDWNAYSETQDPYNAESPPSRVYTFSSDGQFNFSSPTVFDGAYFAGYDYATVQFDLYLGGTLVAASGVLAPSATPTYLASGYSGLVDEVQVTSPDPDFYVMDNVTYGPVSAAPEPSTWLLMLAGIGGIGYAFRQAKRKHGFRLKDAFAA